MIPRRYAADTSVSVERTQAEIILLLVDHRATARAVGVDDPSGRAMVMFELGGRRIRVEVMLPTVASLLERGHPRGWRSWDEGQRQRWLRQHLEQEVRATWRGILLLLRAKLEAIDGGYSTVEHEFLADLLLPGGQTVHQMTARAIDTAYRTGQVPRLLPGLEPQPDTHALPEAPTSGRSASKPENGGMR